MKQEKIRKIMELMEQERAKLYLLVSEYGLESVQVLEQSKVIDSLLLALMALEKQHNQQKKAPPFTLALTAREKQNKSKRTFEMN